jgi:hypothetical protein
MSEYNQNEDLQCYFGLSYASWLTLPRVLMEAMPDDWQKKMAVLLNEIQDEFPNANIPVTRVQMVEGNKMVKMPEWLKHYRHPDREEIQKCRKHP